MADKSVLVGLSGGVDSAVCAHLLLKEGYLVDGGTLCMFGDTDGKLSEDIRDAAAVAAHLGIAHHTIDLREEFKSSVMQYFADAYLQGLTPNPCVFCNRQMKFPGMFAFAQKNGISKVATGHYARIQKDGDRYLLLRGADASKDQTYMLYALTQEMLSHTLFPLGTLSKAQIREIAAHVGLPVASKHDSQDICFIKDGDYTGFIERFTGQVSCPGDFIDTCGKVIARHKGIVSYTIGQRKGLGIASTEPYYVVSKDAVHNTVTLGRANDLFCKRIKVSHANFIALETPQSSFRATAKVRYSQTDSACTVFPEKDGFILEFDSPQRAITPGQSAVLYDRDVVLGGGIIEGK